MSIGQSLRTLAAEWAVPKQAVHHGESSFLRLRCTVDLEVGCLRWDEPIPEPLTELWSTCDGAALFEDVDYGQWGLVLLPPAAARAATRMLWSERPNDCITGDLVIGRFLGDQELLLVRCDPYCRDFGQVLVADEIYARSRWRIAAPDLAVFVQKYGARQGEKFWERTAS